MKREILKKLIEKKSLDKEDIFQAMEVTLSGESPAWVGAFLSLMESKKATSSELLWVLEAMRPKSLNIKYSGPLLDIVGTGGDTANTFNISTGSAILSAALGIKIAKHGNRSVSSQCGSADVLEEMGVKLELNQNDIIRCLDEVGIAFMYAPIFHPAMKAVKEIRSQLKIRTLFNFLGPMLNPANASHMIVGVYDENLLDLVGGCFAKMGKKAIVLCSPSVDEVTPASKAQARFITKERVENIEINPTQYGVKKCTLGALEGKDKKYNSKRLLDVLKGEKGPWADTLVLNAAIALFLCKKVKTIEEGVSKAKEAHEKGLGYQKLKAWAELTQKL